LEEGLKSGSGFADGLGMKWIFFLLAISSTALGKPLQSQEELRAIEKAHVAVAEIEAEFRKALALSHCRIQKPEKKGVTRVGRTSLRLRNPKNTAPIWVRPYLEKFSKQTAASKPKPALVELGKNHFGYVEPIFVQPICLNCHGSNLEKGVREFLQKDYPGDQAFGYSEGDFRGILWLELSNN